MLAAVLGRSLSIFFRNILLESFGQKVVKDLKQTLYNHLQKLSFDFFHQNRTGELMARMTADIDAIRDLLAQGTIKLSFGIFYIVLTTAVLFRLNVTLALLAALPVPFVGLTAYWGAKTIRAPVQKRPQAVLIPERHGPGECVRHPCGENLQPTGFRA